MKYIKLITTLFLFITISCKQKFSEHFKPNPETAIYVDDSDKYFELLNLYDDTISTYNYTKKDLPIEIINVIAKNIHIDTNKIADIGKASCQCVGYNPGLEFIALDKYKQKGFVMFCQGTEIAWTTILYFNLSNKYSTQMFKITYNRYLPYENTFYEFYNSILNRNVIVGQYQRRY